MAASQAPEVLRFPKMREHHFDLASIDLSPECLKSFDCVLVATNHDAFDYERIQNHASLVVDSCGAYRKVFENVVKA